MMAAVRRSRMVFASKSSRAVSDCFLFVPMADLLGLTWSSCQASGTHDIEKASLARSTGTSLRIDQAYGMFNCIG